MFNRSFVLMAVLLATPAFAQTKPATLPFTISKETTRITEPLAADGSVDYVAALNAKYSKNLKPEENGFVRWFQTVGYDASMPKEYIDRILKPADGVARVSKHESLSDFLRRDPRFRNATEAELNAFEEKLQDLKGRVWGPDESPEVITYLASQKVTLDAANAASQIVGYWHPYLSKEGSVMGISLIALGQVRAIANNLGARAMQRFSAGDFDGFAQDVLTIQRISRWHANSGTLIEQLIGSACNNVAIDAISAAATSRNLTEKQSAALIRQLKEFPATADSSSVFDSFERAAALDFAQRLALKKITGETWATAAGVGDTLKIELFRVKPADVDWDVIFKNLNACYDDLVTISKTSFGADLEKATQAFNAKYRPAHMDPEIHIKKADETREAYTQRVQQQIQLLVLPVFDRIIKMQRRTNMRSQMNLALLSAVAHRADTGKWPESLNVLVPKYLDRVPTDIFSANGKEPVRYVLREQGPTIYSVGFNHRDEGGIYVLKAGKPDDFFVGGKINPPADTQLKP